MPDLDVLKRAPIFTRVTEKVLVKIFGHPAIQGFSEVPRDDRKIEVQHLEDAEDRGLDPVHFRAKADSGYPILQQEPGCRTKCMLKSLKRSGLVATNFFIQSKPNGKPVHVVEFTLNADKGVTIPADALDILTNWRFAEVSVWANFRPRQDQDGQFRLDTINLIQPQRSSKPARSLTRVGFTYKLLEPTA